MLLSETYKKAVFLKNKYGLFDWKVMYISSKRTFGYCQHGSKTIAFSEQMVKLNDSEIVEDVILHEIAHALCDPSIGHGKEWKEKCATIKCSGEVFAFGAIIPIKERFYFKISCEQCNRQWIVSKEKNYRCLSCNSPVITKKVFGDRDELNKTYVTNGGIFEDFKECAYIH